jgi:hypothetical protein
MTVITPLNDIRPVGNRFGFFPFGKKWVLQYPSKALQKSPASEDYEKAVKTAKGCLDWVENKIKESEENKGKHKSE